MIQLHSQFVGHSYKTLSSICNYLSGVGSIHQLLALFLNEMNTCWLKIHTSWNFQNERSELNLFFCFYFPKCFGPLKQKKKQTITTTKKQKTNKI
jgi:hypothetical protein